MEPKSECGEGRTRIVKMNTLIYAIEAQDLKAWTGWVPRYLKAQPPPAVSESQYPQHSTVCGCGGSLKNMFENVLGAYSEVHHDRISTSGFHEVELVT
jgi:hypothetical protein